MRYLYSLGVFVLIYSVVVAIHYIFGFLLLAFIYMAILARIRRMRAIHSKQWVWLMGVVLFGIIWYSIRRNFLILHDLVFENLQC